MAVLAVSCRYRVVALAGAVGVLLTVAFWDRAASQAAASPPVQRPKQPLLLAGVPVHNTHLAGDAWPGDSARRLRGRSPLLSWILMLRANASDEDVRRLCREGRGVAPSAASAASVSSAAANTMPGCQAAGRPSVGGLAFASLLATAGQLEGLLQRHAGLVDFAEIDGLVRLVPANRSSTTLGARSHETGLNGTVQKPAPWGLDRIDQRWLPLDGHYTPAPGAGQGVHIYMADTGIRTTHQAFGGRAIPTLEVVGNGVRECHGNASCAMDYDGHGTHTAGIAGGRFYGVAPNVTLHAVKVLNDTGVGQWSWFVAALNWVAAKGVRPAVFSASLGSSDGSPAVARAIERATSAGVTVVVAAGNEGSDACSFYPASLNSVITVGATSSSDKRAGYSNYGACVDVFAPGTRILSTYSQDDNDVAVLSGTSMACPHVAGAAALLLHAEPSLRPAEVAARLTARATQDAVQDYADLYSVDLGAQNLLLYTGANESQQERPSTTTATTTTILLGSTTATTATTTVVETPVLTSTEVPCSSSTEGRTTTAETTLDMATTASEATTQRVTEATSTAAVTSAEQTTTTWEDTTATTSSTAQEAETTGPAPEVQTTDAGSTTVMDGTTLGVQTTSEERASSQMTTVEKLTSTTTPVDGASLTTVVQATTPGWNGTDEEQTSVDPQTTTAMQEPSTREEKTTTHEQTTFEEHATSLDIGIVTLDNVTTTSGEALADQTTTTQPATATTT